MRAAWLLACIAAAVLGCSASTPTKSIQFQGAVSVTSDKRAVIRLNHGRAAASMAADEAEAFTPAVRGPDPGLRFHRQDQQRFARELGQELERLGLFEAVGVGAEGVVDTEVVIELVFAETRHLPKRQQYVLDVVLLAASADHAMAAQYRVVADVQDSLWSTDVHEAEAAKRQAAQNLLDYLIPDLQEFLRRMDPPRTKPVVLSRRPFAL